MVPLNDAFFKMPLFTVNSPISVNYSTKHTTMCSTNLQLLNSLRCGTLPHTQKAQKSFMEMELKSV